MRILLDVDGVLANFTGHTLDTLVKMGGPSIRYEDITEWDVLSKIPAEWRGSLVQAWRKPGWCRSMPQYEGANLGVGALMNLGDVHFVTAGMPKSPTWADERVEWLRYYYGVDHRDVTFTHAKEWVEGDVFIDDKEEHVIEWYARHPTGCAILFMQPYNRVSRMPRGVHASNDWPEIASVVAQHDLFTNPSYQY